MTNTPQTIDELRESFNRVYNGPDRLQREYDLVMESERLGVPLDTYRRLYELRGEEHMNPYPKPKNWQYAPREWGRWFWNLPKTKKGALIRKGGFWVVKQSFFVTVAFGLINYLRETPKREKLAHYQAWQMINSATGQKASAGRVEALQDLNKDGVSLVGLDANGANLQNINLQKAQLGKANLSKANLFKANLSKAEIGLTNLSQAHLLGVDFSQAHLINTNLSQADLSEANLSQANLFMSNLSKAELFNANLNGSALGCASYVIGVAPTITENIYCTNLKGAKNLTPEQIKKAKNWQKACYDPEFRKKLGLPPENPKNCAGEEKK